MEWTIVIWKRVKSHALKFWLNNFTGDHIQTALSVARESKMIDSSASNVIIVKAKIDDETLEPSYFFHSLDNVQPIVIQGKKVCWNFIGTLSR